MSNETAKRVASRFLSAQDTDHADPNVGIFGQSDYDSLEDKTTWKGYKYKSSEWTWNADTYEDSDEPNNWGDNTLHGPVKTLDDVLSAISKPGVKWGSWVDADDGKLQSVVKKTKKEVIQQMVTIERADGKRLTYDERDYIESRLKLKR